MSVQCENNYCKNVVLSEHTVTDHSKYNYINTQLKNIHSIII